MGNFANIFYYIKKRFLGSKYEEKITYLLNEVSELRQIVRILQSDSELWREWMAKTYQSFDSQWESLSDGAGLASDEEFRKSMLNLVEQYTSLPKSWFAGKRILDAGCGNGRWSLALSTLGAQVTAFDQSRHGVEATRTLCANFPDFSVIQHDILDTSPFQQSFFDLVWSFGVMHHTGNTLRAFNNIAPLVKPGGYFFLMLYGEPTTQGDYAEINEYVLHRRAIHHISLAEKIAYCKQHFEPQYIHGWFDAISPPINDLYRFDEIRNWLVHGNFWDIKKTTPNRNLFIIAQKKCT